jgi:hypothetical protein
MQDAKSIFTQVNTNKTVIILNIRKEGHDMKRSLIDSNFLKRFEGQSFYERGLTANRLFAVPMALKNDVPQAL